MICPTKKFFLGHVISLNVEKWYDIENSFLKEKKEGV